MKLDGVAPGVLEPVTARAWRAAEEAALGDWRLNASAGFSGRINACWPVGEPGLETQAAIEAVEAWYAGRGFPARFKLAAGLASPADLGERLVARGYAISKETLVMAGPVGGGKEPGVELAGAPDRRFEAIFQATAEDPLDAAERLGALWRTPDPRAFARAEIGGETAAIGACAVEAPYVGIFAMRTAPAHRRRGLARAVLGSLLGFGQEAGARIAWLQVEAANTGARRLYEGAGFVEAYRYRYWTAPSG